uniref:Rab proteins geranylgeranyltransferase component n=1 Tax=Chromera velia CCMP2878 TaxID=1169474 RepID=A0A0G4FAD1_9ALVE|eukprot:Cvel_15855.t1-p1 / transcript=Cvel_15855.t1 / gene=Cvel_15855 / organism=Chromera_velia_CCMP2878 / gene_product=Rab proteins geranylgeranyltransferase component A, putative / transcript_product=Rab proteins geranylgeranyltransferase component A, putative / location=Cvel_scaffold1195:14428-20293(+) / protein_length=808 / sequence_SO=supercontig / SO=protein_coding / is_pseudo=false
MLDAEEKDPDVVVLGTGLTECFTAASLALSGFKVVHLDRNQHYGGGNASFSLSGLLRWCSPPSGGEDEDSKQEETELNETEKEFLRDAQLLKLPIEASKEPSGYLNARRFSFAPFSESEEERESVRKNLLAKSNAFNLDLLPHAVKARSETVELLIRCGVARYLEFTGLKSISCLTDEGSVHQVPLTKSEIFKDSRLTLVEKRLLMKFVTSFGAPSAAFQTPKTLQSGAAVQESPEQQAESVRTGDQEEGTGDWDQLLREANLTERLRNYLTFGVCMRERSDGVWPASAGLGRLTDFVSSLGLYGATCPFLFPLYGAGDVPQAFTRVAALYGTVQLLRTGARELWLGKGGEGVRGHGIKFGRSKHKRPKYGGISGAQNSCEDEKKEEGAEGEGGNKDGTCDKNGEKSNEETIPKDTEKDGEVNGASEEPKEPVAADQCLLPLASPSEWRVAGLPTTDGQFLRAPLVIASADYLPEPLREELKPKSSECVRHFVMVTDIPCLKSKEGTGMQFCFVAPGTNGVTRPVQVIQLDSASGCAPRGFFVLHGCQLGDLAGREGEGDDFFELRGVMEKILQQALEGDDENDQWRRRCLFTCTFVRLERIDMAKVRSLWGEGGREMKPSELQPGKKEEGKAGEGSCEDSREVLRDLVRGGWIVPVPDCTLTPLFFGEESLEVAEEVHKFLLRVHGTVGAGDPSSAERKGNGKGEEEACEEELNEEKSPFRRFPFMPEPPHVRDEREREARERRLADLERFADGEPQAQGVDPGSAPKEGVQSMDDQQGTSKATSTVVEKSDTQVGKADEESHKNGE